MKIKGIFKKKITPDFPNGRPRFLKLRRMLLQKPETLRRWTTIYYGDRGGGKTLHQSKETLNILRYLTKLYRLFPKLPHKIVFTNQHIAQKVLDVYGENGKYGNLIYHWEECEDFHYCPRKNCWRGRKKHLLHGAILVFDDVSIILDPRNWPNTPNWLQKYFFLGRHFSINMLASLVNPLAVDISFRRCVDMAYQFTKFFGSRDPDETLPGIKTIFGIYRRRKVDAKTLWSQGDLPEQTIRLMLLEREEREKALRESGHSMDIVEDTSWFGSYHIFTRTGKFWPFGFKLFGYMFFKPVASTEIYDTLQNVKEFEPKGLLCDEIRCIDPKHVHPWDEPNTPILELKKRPNFCDKIKRVYEVV